jgi:D-inositol-3-phosphate glycosyltransferase
MPDHNRIRAAYFSISGPASEIVRDHGTLVKDDRPTATSAPASGPEIALLTGGQDKHYMFGFATALASAGVRLDVIGSDDVDCAELHSDPQVRFLNLRGSLQSAVGIREKLSRVLRYYGRLIRYASSAKPKVFHILWNNRFELFDRTLLMLYYKLLGKKLVFTAHNVNAGKRDSADTLLNRLSLTAQYRLVDRIVVHTDKMKRELKAEFGVSELAITVIPYGINNAIPITELSTAEAKQRCGIKPEERSILFFGAIAPYKGLDVLVKAFGQLPGGSGYRLIIAGKPKGGCDEYMKAIQQEIQHSAWRAQAMQRIEFIPDEDTELYFKAADLLVLPYRSIFQSGILFLSFSFGLPVVASDVGSFREDVIEGETGFLCRPGDPQELAKTIEKYFQSDLFSNLHRKRREIQEGVAARHSWDAVARIMRNAYEDLDSGRNFTAS